MRLEVVPATGTDEDTDDGPVTLPKVKRNRARLGRNAVRQILIEDPAFADRLSYNEMSSTMLLDGAPIAAGDLGRLMSDIQDRYKARDIGEGTMRDVVVEVARQRSFNPVADYLAEQRVAWDGRPRFEEALVALGVPSPRPIHRRYLETWMIGAVARALSPGVKMDTVLVLQGPQGTRKSTALRVLAEGPGEGYFHDHIPPLTNRDAFLTLHGKWIIEWAEFEDLLASHRDGVVKAFLSSNSDYYRRPYAAVAEEEPRRSVICASTNTAEFLRDETGHRRFMVLPTVGVDTAALMQLRDQLWGEAAARYAHGEEWWLNPTEEREQREANARFETGNELRERVSAFTAGRSNVPAGELWREVEDLGPSTRELGRIMRGLGWHRTFEHADGLTTRVWTRGAERVDGAE